ncbi:hypothetical protein [Variovorax sp. GT1P44]|uniref:hypothetical protein n=1 Tax=Variovorax sp. GT1P44 TaxID=3443742 RepID=UPI003F446675
MANAQSFIADMNALQRELAVMPPQAADAICRLMQLVDLQNENIATLLSVNRKLLDEIDRLKG